MKKKSLIWQIYPSHLFVVVLSVIAVTWYASIAIRAFHYAHTRDELTSAALLAAEHLKALSVTGPVNMQSGNLESDKIDAVCKSLGRSSGYRLTFILPSGKVRGDSEENPETMDNHGNRPEIGHALSKGAGMSTHYSRTLRKKMMYVAVPVVTDGRTEGVVRVSLPLAAIDEALHIMWRRIGIAGMVIGCIAAFISIIVSRKITRPLEELRKGAESVGQGNSRSKLAPSGVLEIDVLAKTMNRMADQLNERISTITQQRDEQNALFSCMIESVFAVDAEKRLIKMNKSAEDLFHADASCRGKNIMEVIRNGDLLDVVAWALESSEPVEGNVFIPAGNRYLQAHGTVLQGADGHRIGALIVLNDITRLRKLEIVRRDFVANVSHELRTPITSIKGFMDTLLNGDTKDPAQTERFLHIVARQADRLNAIIEDLLALSRLEQEEEKTGITLEDGFLNETLQGAIQVCEHKAREKQIEIRLQCGEHITARINTALLEQAVVNLLDNALKYSPPGGRVWIEGYEEKDRIMIHVRDKGSGMEARHLSRIFERFYRVDKTRSSSLGSTGLGLAIVKHIAMAHNGNVAVESRLGKGSTFSISLPKI